MASDWPITVDELRFQPVPRSWVENGIDTAGDGPQLLAVAAATDGDRVHVRYVHPYARRVAIESYPVYRHPTEGWVPRQHLAEAWPRSISGDRVEPVDDCTLVERRYVTELWDGLLEHVLTRDYHHDLDDERLVADGGRSVDLPHECPCGAQYNSPKAAAGCCGARLLREKWRALGGGL